MIRMIEIIIIIIKILTITKYLECTLACRRVLLLFAQHSSLGLDKVTRHAHHTHHLSHQITSHITSNHITHHITHHPSHTSHITSHTSSCRFRACSSAYHAITKGIHAIFSKWPDMITHQFASSCILILCSLTRRQLLRIAPVCLFDASQLRKVQETMKMTSSFPTCFSSCSYSGRMRPMPCAAATHWTCPPREVSSAGALTRPRRRPHWLAGRVCGRDFLRRCT